VNRHISRLDPLAAERLKTWQEKALPSKYLPPQLIKDWNYELKNSIAERIRSWFKANKLPEPQDILQQPTTRREDSPKLAALRGFLTRIDDEKREWKLSPRLFHGNDTLYVAGCQLRAGFHWDVRPISKTTQILTTTAVWRVNRYINVTPDAQVRGGPPHAEMIFPRNKSPHRRRL
jgi:hypothetical protein